MVTFRAAASTNISTTAKRSIATVRGFIGCWSDLERMIDCQDHRELQDEEEGHRARLFIAAGHTILHILGSTETREVLHSSDLERFDEIRALEGETLERKLFYAALAGNVVIVRLLEKGADVNAEVYGGRLLYFPWDPLHIAMRGSRSFEPVEALFDANADPYQKTQTGASILFIFHSICPAEPDT